jgi:hypothetical protein
LATSVGEKSLVPFGIPTFIDWFLVFSFWFLVFHSKLITQNLKL